MPFEAAVSGPRKIAVIGGGISGMGAAHLLADRHRVTLFEAEKKLGGHARTRIAGKRGDQAVDTGFIVFNYANYPLLAALFHKLGVPVAPSNMSFAASIDGGRVEYGFRDLQAILAAPGNLVRPGYIRMLRDILRFNEQAPGAVAAKPDLTIAELFDQIGVGRWFRDYYFKPISGAIWSTPAVQMSAFPAKALIDFFQNHALLQVRNQHQWWTVQGGSTEYVSRLSAAMKNQGVEIRTGAPIAGVKRDAIGVEVRAFGSETERFDEVVFATHSDDSLRLLADATPQEQSALGAVKYQPNEVVLHSDPSVMPRRRGVWSSWNYTEPRGKESDVIDLTYWMNSLQPIPKDDPLFVTLNSTQAIRDDLIYDTCTLRHPVYDAGALVGQAEVRALNGANGTWFCGAWMKNGFHEDGLSSALDVVEAIFARDTIGIAAQ